MIDMTTPMGSWKTPAPGSGSRARTDSSEGFGSRRVYSSQVYWVTEVSVTWQLACSVDVSTSAHWRANVSFTICSARTCSRLNRLGRRKSYGAGSAVTMWHIGRREGDLRRGCATA